MSEENIKKITIQKKINGKVYDIYVKTSADHVTYEDTTVEEALRRLTVQNILIDTTANWKEKASTISKKGTIYIYSDYDKTEDNKDMCQYGTNEKSNTMPQRKFYVCCDKYYARNSINIRKGISSYT